LEGEPRLAEPSAPATEERTIVFCQIRLAIREVVTVRAAFYTQLGAGIPSAGHARIDRQRCPGIATRSETPMKLACD
jgi:hypothetical protein